MTIVYKATDKERKSVGSPKYNTLTYSTEFVTRPTVGYIFAFKTLEDARWFMGSQLAIWKAEATVVDPHPSRMLPGNDVDFKGAIDAFWTCPETNIWGWSCPPTGTIYCSELRLIERII